MSTVLNNDVLLYPNGDNLKVFRTPGPRNKFYIIFFVAQQTIS